MKRPKKTTIKKIGKSSYVIKFSEKDGKAFAESIKKEHPDLLKGGPADE